MAGAERFTIGRKIVFDTALDEERVLVAMAHQLFVRNCGKRPGVQGMSALRFVH
jgi:hypothetical protein